MPLAPFGTIYDIVFGNEIAGEMRRRNSDQEAYNHHQLLQPKVANGLRDELAIVELVAK